MDANAKLLSRVFWERFRNFDHTPGFFNLYLRRGAQVSASLKLQQASTIMSALISRRGLTEGYRTGSSKRGARQTGGPPKQREGNQRGSSTGDPKARDSLQSIAPKEDPNMPHIAKQANMWLKRAPM